MSYPNLPLQAPDWQRRATQAVNHLLNETLLMHVKAAGTPSASQVLVDEEFAVTSDILPGQCVLKCDVAPTNDATFAITIGGVSAGSGVILANRTTGTLSFTTTALPGFTRLKITAPSVADPTLADIRFFIAFIQ